MQKVVQQSVLETLRASFKDLDLIAQLPALALSPIVLENGQEKRPNPKFPLRQQLSMFLQSMTGKIEDIRSRQDMKTRVNEYFATDEDVIRKGGEFLDAVLGGDSSPTVRVLKCCNPHTVKAAIAGYLVFFGVDYERSLIDAPLTYAFKFFEYELVVEVRKSVLLNGMSFTWVVDFVYDKERYHCVDVKLKIGDLVLPESQNWVLLPPPRVSPVNRTLKDVVAFTGAFLDVNDSKSPFHGAKSKTYANGDFYKGGFDAEGFRDGWGLYISYDGAVYSGMYNRGVRHGPGSYFAIDGSLYSGEWNEGDFVSGIFANTNGEYYSGKFSFLEFEGIGQYMNTLGGSYRGSFSIGRRQGRGTMTWANGDTYKGEWSEGEMTGEGLYAFANGDVYAGHFLKGKPHGQGEYISMMKSGRITGKFENGVFQPDPDTPGNSRKKEKLSFSRAGSTKDKEKVSVVKGSRRSVKLSSSPVSSPNAHTDTTTHTPHSPPIPNSPTPPTMSPAISHRTSASAGTFSNPHS